MSGNIKDPRKAKPTGTQVLMRFPEDVRALIDGEKERVLRETGYAVAVTDVVMMCIRRQLERRP